MPERSVIEPPSAASTYGTAMRITCATNASEKHRVDHASTSLRRTDPRADAATASTTTPCSISVSSFGTRSATCEAARRQERRAASAAIADADGMRAAEQRDRDAEEARAAAEPLLERMLVTEHEARRGEPGERARRRSSRAICVAPDGDADGARRLGIAADRAPALAPRRARAQPPHERDHARAR